MRIGIIRHSISNYPQPSKTDVARGGVPKAAAQLLGQACGTVAHEAQEDTNGQQDEVKS